MSQIIKKEIRLLLPSWITAMALAIAPAWIAGTAWNLDYFENDPQSGFWMEGIVPVVFALGILFLGISPFGQECGQGTFTILLSQPAERSRIWRTKIITLAIAFFTVWLAGVVSIGSQFYLYDYFHPIPTYQYYVSPLSRHLIYMGQFHRFSIAFDYAIGLLTLSVLAVSSGGLWTTLLLRQTTAAFWFTLLTPLAIILGISSIMSDRLASGGTFWPIIVVALAVYSVVGFLAAWRLFMRAQDLPWAGGEISLPGRQVLSKNRVIPSKGPNHWFRALAWKEVQLQQVNLLIAAIMLVLHLGCVVVRKIHPRFNNPDIQFVFETFWIFWLLMPVLIGCASMAEERRTGVMESQLCLPVSRRVQWFIKFLVGLCLSLFLGGVLPLLIEGKKAGGGGIFIFAAALFFISFYASSLSRTTLQAIGLTTLLNLFLFYQVQQTFDPLSQRGFSGTDLIGFALLKICLGLPILVATFGWLVYWNFRWVHPGKKVALRNVIVLVAAILSASVSANGIYFRAWELLKPIGPAIGPVRLSGSTELRLSTSPSAISAVLPDGRLWVEKLADEMVSNRWQGEFLLLAPQRDHAEFIGGSNWVDAAGDYFQIVGIKDNGTLWSIQQKWDGLRPRTQEPGAFTVTQIGTDTDWTQAAPRMHGFLLLKRDGTLWIWGTSGFAPGRRTLAKKMQADLSKMPIRIGDETNWAGVYASEFNAFAKKKDGTFWGWTNYDVETGRPFGITKDPNLNGHWSEILVRPGGFVGVNTNGELWLGEQMYNNHIEQRQIGESMKWKAAVYDGWIRIAAIRDDGTLWRLAPENGYWVASSYAQPAKLDQLGNDSCWVALLQPRRGSGVIAVASDGSLWLWDQSSRHFWLAPPRRPVHVGNIFESTTATTSRAQ